MLLVDIGMLIRLETPDLLAGFLDVHEHPMSTNKLGALIYWMFQLKIHSCVLCLCPQI